MTDYMKQWVMNLDKDVAVPSTGHEPVPEALRPEAPMMVS